jgi:quinoprotein dehydrogenase-associated probable ABC transporter substrate-binding protein
LLALLAALSTGSAIADEGGVSRAFRVCQDPNNLPFSSDRGEGFENRIAELFAAKLGWKVQYYSFPQRLGFIRNTLRFKLPGEDYPCDVVMGVPARYDQTATTKAYYRSTYALVFPEGRGLDAVQSSADLLALPNERLAQLRIGVYDRSPASEWLAKHGLVDSGIPYRILSADPNQYAGEIIEKDLTAGKIDAAIVWGPIAGYFAKRMQEPKLRVVPLAPEPGVKLEYAIAMGVRFGEPEWKATLERLIAEHQAQIDAILREYGVPLLDVEGGPRN